MCKKDLIAIVFLIVFISGLCVSINCLRRAEAVPIDRYHSSWHLVRATADEDGANFAAVYNIDANEADFAGKDANSVADGGAFRIPSFHTSFGEGYSPGTTWMFIIGGVPTNGDNDTYSFNLVGWAKTNGMLQNICEGNGTLGTQDVVIYPDATAAPNGLWADVIGVDETTKWPKYRGNLVGADVYNSGDNEVCVLVVNLTGLEWIQFVLYDCDGSTSDEAGDITVYGRRW